MMQRQNDKKNIWMVHYLLPMLNIDRESNPCLVRLLETRCSDDFFPALEAYQNEVAAQILRIMDEMPGGFFVYHADGDESLIYFNIAMLRIFGCETAEEFLTLTGNSFRGIVHPDDLDAVEESIVHQISNSTYDLDYVEYRIIRKDGQVRWLEDYGHFVHTDTAGDIFYVFVSDATEKRDAQIQESLRQETHWKSQIDKYSRELEVISREHLHRLEVIEALSIDYDSIFYIDSKADLVHVYRLQKQFEGHRERKLSLQQFRTLFMEHMEGYVNSEDCDRFIQELSLESIREKLCENESFYLNYRGTTKGELRYRQIRVVKVRREDPYIQFVMGFRNVDEEIRYEMEQKKTLEDALRQAASANIAKNTFLSNMSHDIRTPLNAIVGFTSLAKNHANEQEKLLHYLDKIEESSEQLLRLLSNVLELSRIESGKVQAVETPCNLLSLLQDVYHMILPKADDKELILRLDTKHLPHVHIYSDSEKLMQIFSYLLNNACKYTNPGGHIYISAAETEYVPHTYATYQFDVKDTGIGISEEFLAHIFDPFERERNTTLSGVAGMGLGLTIIKSIVEMLGGTITVQSQPGQGSCFTVTLRFRLQPVDEKETTGTGSDTSSDPMPARKILVVEDNEINREIITELLLDAAFTVDTAENGKEAVDMLRKAAPDNYLLVLMDIQMPVMNGYEAARQIRSLPDERLSHIPIIAISANAFEEDIQMSKASGMNAHLAKPVHIDTLLEVIEETTHSP